MQVYNTKHGEVVVYAKTIEQDAISQIYEMANSPLGENAHIRIMPDCHAGAGCVIGTTMRIIDKVCPNLVGVDIGCGVDLVHTDIEFADRLDELDGVIREKIPFGMENHEKEKPWQFEKLLCWEHLDKESKLRAKTSLGTLGGGNHFIEAYQGGWLAVHSGSRNIGWKVADYYQKLAEKCVKEENRRITTELLHEVEPAMREKWLKEHRISINRDLSYLTGEEMRAYLHDVKLMQEFASDNRKTMLETIVKAMGGTIIHWTKSVHNYIDTDAMILRKGAISAKKDESLVIPLNMRDGILVCSGKGNPDWNYSAPHGAGRLYSRSKAKELFTVEEYSKKMEGIYSTCISETTLDEAPFAYKDFQEIIDCIYPTVEIIEHLKPIYNFKAN